MQVPAGPPIMVRAAQPTTGPAARLIKDPAVPVIPGPEGPVIRVPAEVVPARRFVVTNNPHKAVTLWLGNDLPPLPQPRNLVA